MQKSFDEVKEKLTFTRIFSLSNFKKTFNFEHDAQEVGVKGLELS